MKAEHGFRDLFVELPAAVLEMLRGIGESAVAIAKPNHSELWIDALYSNGRHPRPRIYREPNLQLVLRRYGWSSVYALVQQNDTRTRIVATMTCGHHQIVPINEVLFTTVSTPDEEVALLDRLVDEHPPTCYCVRQETP